jgi:hypothetical protein
MTNEWGLPATAVGALERRRWGRRRRRRLTPNNNDDEKNNHDTIIDRVEQLRSTTYLCLNRFERLLCRFQRGCDFIQFVVCQRRRLHSRQIVVNVGTIVCRSSDTLTFVATPSNLRRISQTDSAIVFLNRINYAFEQKHANESQCFFFFFSKITKSSTCC